MTTACVSGVTMIIDGAPCLRPSGLVDLCRWHARDERRNIVFHLRIQHDVPLVCRRTTNPILHVEEFAWWIISNRAHEPRMMNDGLRPRVRTPRALQVSLGRRCRPGDRHQATEACRCIVELSRAAQPGSDATFDHARAEAPPLRYLHRWPAGLAPFQ